MEYEVSSTKDSVRLWSDVRLPFEPKGEVRAMRDALRNALRELDGSKLSAAFGGRPGAAFDIENVLFYNVGCSAFRKCSGTDLYFERRFSPSPAPSGRDWAWSHEYRTGEMARSWAASGRAAGFTFGGEGKLPDSAARFWSATHFSEIDRNQVISDTAPLLLRLKVASRRPVNLTDVVKPLTDGILCGLHTYDGSAADLVAERSSLALGIDPQETRVWLGRAGPLGGARFVSRRAAGLQWSPADDRLVAVQMTWEPSNANSWSLDVALSEAVAELS